MKLICTAFFLVLIIASCGKAIPGETMDGRGTFYCKVNGEDYFPDCFGFACRDVNASYSTFGDAIGLEALRYIDGDLMDIYIYIYNVTTNPSLVAKSDPEMYLDNTFIRANCTYYLSNVDDIKVSLTKVDLTEGIVSGTFSGIIRDTSEQTGCGYKEFVLTDGIFDLPITF